MNKEYYEEKLREFYCADKSARNEFCIGLLVLQAYEDGYRFEDFRL